MKRAMHNRSAQPNTGLTARHGLGLHQPNEAPTPSQQAPDHQLLGLDSVRAWSAVGVVLLHACVPYSHLAMPGLTWCVTDQSSVPVGYAMWSIEVVIMPIFLVVAGFLATRSLSNRSPTEFVRGRLRRLGKPFLIAVIILSPIELYLWMLGWLAEGQIPLYKIRSLKFTNGVDKNLWGISHLWFLQYLLTYALLLAAAWPLRRIVERAFGRHHHAVELAACLAVAFVSLCIWPEVVWGFQHAFLPVASKWIYSGAFFALGAAWFRTDPNLHRLSEIGPRLLTPGILFWGAAVMLGVWRLDILQTGMPSPDVSPMVLTTLAGITVATATLVTLGWIGVASRTTGLSQLTRRLADASFTIYLLHHPVLALTHISLKFSAIGIPPLLKTLISATIAIGIAWAMDWLWNQRKRRRSNASTTQSIEMPGQNTGNTNTGNTNTGNTNTGNTNTGNTNTGNTSPVNLPASIRRAA